MKAVFLDYESLDKQDLDFSQLKAAFDDLILYPSTTAEQVLARIQYVD
ncbi:MAG: glycerate dehydrogenase, partial [Pseudomonadota bacterium]